MNSPGRQTGSFGDELTDILMIALIGVFALTLVLRAAGAIAAFLTGVAQPEAGITGGMGVFFNPSDPGGALGSPNLNPIVYWIVAALMLAALGAVGTWCWVLLAASLPQGRY